MSVLKQRLSTGDVMVFDKDSRDLYLIPKEEAEEVEAPTKKGLGQALVYARRLAEQGRARHFNRRELEQLQAALSGIVVLG